MFKDGNSSRHWAGLIGGISVIGCASLSWMLMRPAPPVAEIQAPTPWDTRSLVAGWGPETSGAEVEARLGPPSPHPLSSGLG